MNNDLEVAHPLSGSSSSCFLTELELKKLVFEERGKPEYPVKKLHGEREWTNDVDKLNPHMAFTLG